MFSSREFYVYCKQYIVLYTSQLMNEDYSAQPHTVNEKTPVFPQKSDRFKRQRDFAVGPADLTAWSFALFRPLWVRNDLSKRLLLIRVRISW